MRKARITLSQTPELFPPRLSERGSFSNHSLFLSFFLLFCFLTCFSVFLLFALSWELCSDRPSLVNGFSFNKLPFCDTPPNKYLGKFPTTSSLYVGAHFISKSSPSYGPSHPGAELPSLQGIPSAMALGPTLRGGNLYRRSAVLWR